MTDTVEQDEFVTPWMLDRVVERSRKEEYFLRGDTPTEERVEATFLYHAGLANHHVAGPHSQPSDSATSMLSALERSPETL